MGRGRIDTLRSNSSDETCHFGKQLGNLILNSTNLQSTLICFFGDLGAGKTTFIKGLVEQIAQYPKDDVHSPTFNYLNVYLNHSLENPKPVYHFDLYRLQNVDEFLSKGFDEYLETNEVVCIEWAERIQSLMPADCIQIKMQNKNEHFREIQIVYPEAIRL